MDATEELWPAVAHLVETHGAAGVAVAVVRAGEVVSRGFGVRDVRTREPVTARTLFHLASVSKPVVAAAVVSLARDAGPGTLDLDAPVVTWIPEFRLADGREREVTARGLLSHSSGLPDVSEYGWHDPQLGDEALGEFAASLSGMRLRSDPRTAFSYSNSGFELLGLLLARLVGTTFEDAVHRQVLGPLGLRESTFLRADVSPELAASPHVGMPLTVPGQAYPYSRRHAPSSTLHSNLEDLTRLVAAHLEPGDGSGLLAGIIDELWRPVVPVGDPPWEESAALGWFLGSHRGRRIVGHSGADPGFGARIVLVPEQRTGVVVLANSNTVPTSMIATAALDLVLEQSDEGLTALRGVLPPVVGPVGRVLVGEGVDAAVALFHRLAALEPAAFDLDDEEFEKAVWGAIELHRTDLVRPFLDVWTAVRPGSALARSMRDWADRVERTP